MAQDQKKFTTSDLTVDATSIAPFAVMLANGQRKGARREHEGFKDVNHEIISNQETVGPRAGVTPHDIATFQRLNDEIAEVRKYLAPARKLVSILEDTEAFIDNERHRHITVIASTVEERAKLQDNEDLLGRYEKTRAYRSASANEAARTRRRNAEVEAEAAAAAEVQAAAPSPEKK